MLRLKVDDLHEGCDGEEFQYIHVTGKGNLHILSFPVIPCFNTSMLRVKCKKRRDDNAQATSFNTSMLRVKLAIAEGIIRGLLFQYIHVTGKASIIPKVSSSAACFNTSMLRVKGSKIKLPKYAYSHRIQYLYGFRNIFPTARCFLFA